MARGNQKGTVRMCSHRSTGLDAVPARNCNTITATTETASSVQIDGPPLPDRPGPFTSATYFTPPPTTEFATAPPTRTRCSRGISGGSKKRRKSAGCTQGCTSTAALV